MCWVREVWGCDDVPAQEDRDAIRNKENFEIDNRGISNVGAVRKRAKDP